MELEHINNATTSLSSPSNEPSTTSDDESVSGSHGLSKSQAWNLYASHFLSTWNARTYEFAAVRAWSAGLFIAWLMVPADIVYGFGVS